MSGTHVGTNNSDLGAVNDIVPQTDDTYYLGSATKGLKGIYLTDQTTGTVVLLTVVNGVVTIT